MLMTKVTIMGLLFILDVDAQILRRHGHVDVQICGMASVEIANVLHQQKCTNLAWHGCPGRELPAWGYLASARPRLWRLSQARHPGSVCTVSPMAGHCFSQSFMISNMNRDHMHLLLRWVFSLALTY